MSRTDEDRAFESRLRARLSGDRYDLDAETRSRLGAARRRALEELERPLPFGAARRRVWLAGGGAVAAAVVVALLLRAGLPAEVPARAPVEDLELILSDQDLELLDEPEFYAWIEMQPEVG